MKSTRVLVAATVVTVASYLVATFALGDTPDVSAPSATVRRFLLENRRSIQWSVWASIFALAALTVVIALLRDRMGPGYGTIFFAGGISLVAQTAIGQWIWGALALRPARLDPHTARALLDVVDYYGPVLICATIVMIGATVGLAIKDRLPMWYLVLACVVFAEQLVETITVFGRRGFAEPGGAMNLQVGGPLFMLWLLATVYVYTHEPAAETSVDFVA